MAHENPYKKTTSRTARAYPRGPAPDMPRRARLCSARRALYFQIFVWAAAFVRDGGWGPLRGVQPPRPLLWLKQVEEPVDRGLCEACPASVLIFSSNLCFMRAFHVSCHASVGTGFHHGSLSQLSLKLVGVIHASCSHAIFMRHVSCTCSQCVRA